MARQARPRVPEGPAPDPAIQKLRIRYAKRGRLRFTSSRDFQRSLERALRRADVPMAFSAGFHPHPKISYANAAATGTASEAEYVEISVTRRVEPTSVRLALDEALPAGLDIVEVVEAGPGPLAGRLEASDWQLEFAGLDPDRLDVAVALLLGRESVEVTRMTKSGARTFDVRGAIVAATVLAPTMGGGRAAPREVPDGVPERTPEGVTEGVTERTAERTAERTPEGVTERTAEGAPEGIPEGLAAPTAPLGQDCAILRMVVRHTTPAVRPDDILTALRELADLQPPRSPLVTRLAQGPLEIATARVADPLAADKKAAGM